MVRVGDIGGINNYKSSYNPFTASSGTSHSYPWVTDENDYKGTDIAYFGTGWNESSGDGYAVDFIKLLVNFDESECLVQFKVKLIL